MEDQQRLDKGEGEAKAERSPKEMEHFMLRNKVTWMMATRRPVFCPPSSEDGVFGRPRKGRAAERRRRDGEG